MKEDVFLKKIGNNIKAARLEAGITQVELGYRCDFEKSTISRIEAGRTNPTLLTLKRIAESLDVSIEKLIGINKK